ncbi:monovalent cation/H(+) antiporter subunit G [Corynebacterium pseudotuberculosis]|uniref:Cation:proton antiporter n=1 Tax=Corynebacterium pseudotuberculosis (strain C231) TaxID=681645 RepID=D9QCI9_CORP2|nr:monovalent cation/H(+) antiporter subunit G [Corynebacterium pseudotuberculosis]ADK29608.1 cation:proton antiporter [Corynebacterium pseudotuberculosis FRC41]ADL11265.1 cation:proton antiporter [Corynebacterium pseudotuberculosis C231]ADL21681.1 cation:proton antiporter [Corynebacterium pseudotuberculosis 1002]ADO27076.1 cation:proton antiporter [Corynebacterium pseudotuberculosis I19]AEK93139.1 Na(+)/H(+) antiporter subunit G [Corynebacterium pseudotuberculosis PAT10]
MVPNIITDVVSLVFLFAGAFFALSASIGLIRFRSPLARVHAITKPQTVGLILTIVGAIIRVLGTDSSTGDLGVLVLLVFFALVTSPVTGQRVGRIARREGLYTDTNTVFVDHRDKVRDEK